MISPNKAIVTTQREKILKILDDRDLSIAWCARRLGMSRQLLTAKVNGEREFKGSELFLLKELLGFESMDELFSVFFAQKVA